MKSPMTLGAILAGSSLLVASACGGNTSATETTIAKTPRGDAVPHVCVDRFLPAKDQADAQRTAEAEDATNRKPPTEDPSSVAAPVRSKWKTGRTLRVRFVGGDAAIVAKVKKVASEWMNYADIKLVFDESPDAEIRVAFRSGEGSWSYIGTDALSIPRDRPTMNYGWLDSETDDTEYNRVVLHEFGHALGYIHEHQHPEHGIKWNKEAVYAYYAGPPNNWSKEDVDRNLFAKYSKTTTVYSAFDPASIMLYPIRKEHTLDGFSVGWNTSLSKADKCFTASDRMYNKPGACPN